MFSNSFFLKYVRINVFITKEDREPHHKPHVHAKYEEFEASVGVDGELLIGSLPQKQMKILVGWLAFHEEEVYAAWELAVQGKHFDKIVAKI